MLPALTLGISFVLTSQIEQEDKVNIAFYCDDIWWKYKQLESLSNEI